MADDDQPRETRKPGGRRGEPARRPSMRDTWWPRIDTVQEAGRIARYGFWAAAINAALTGLLLALLLSRGEAAGLAAAPPMVWWAAADVAISVLVAVGLWLYSPAAALVGLVLFVAIKGYGWAVLAGEPNLTALLIAALFVYFYVLGVRGTIARKRLLAAER